MAEKLSVTHGITQTSRKQGGNYAENAVPNIEMTNSLHIVIEFVNKRYSSGNLKTSDVIVGHIIQYFHQRLHD